MPRFRQRIRPIPANLANPIWADDPVFELGYHVRQSALPRPGSMDQLRELVARVESRPLDRRRPLWELYVVEGLAADDETSSVRIALISKTHQAVVDGVTAVDLADVILDPNPDAEPGAPPPWRPAPEPSWPQLMSDAVAGIVRSPRRAGDVLRASFSDLRATAGRLSGLADLARGAARLAARTAAQAAAILAGPAAPASPLNTAIGAQRRFAMVRTDFETYRRIRESGRRDGETVNDVVLTVVTGALRAWLLSRGEGVDRSAFLRALVPVSVRRDESGATGATWETADLDAGDAGWSRHARVASYFVDLPIGEPDPVVRLHQVGYRMKAHNVSAQRIGADALSGLSGFAPPTLHALGARAAGSLSRRTHNLVITNVPGPREPRYVAGAKLLESYPVVPIAAGHALALGVTSYLGHVCYGLNADRDALPDLDVIGQCIEDALAELADAVSGTGGRG